MPKVFFIMFFVILVMSSTASAHSCIFPGADKYNIAFIGKVIERRILEDETLGKQKARKYTNFKIIKPLKGTWFNDTMDVYGHYFFRSIYLETAKGVFDSGKETDTYFIIGNIDDYGFISFGYCEKALFQNMELHTASSVINHLAQKRKSKIKFMLSLVLLICLSLIIVILKDKYKKTND